MGVALILSKMALDFLSTRDFQLKWHYFTWQHRGRWFRGTGDMFLLCLFWHLFWFNLSLDSSGKTFLSGLTLIFCFLSLSTSEQIQQHIHHPYWTPYTSTLDNTYTNTTTLFTMHTKPQQPFSNTNNNCNHLWRHHTASWLANKIAGRDYSR